MRTISSLCGLLLVALLGTAVRAARQQELQPACWPDRLHVKLVEGCGAEWRDGALRSRTGVDLRSVQGWFDRAQVSPLVTAVSWDELDRWHQRACARLPVGRRPGHMGLWFRLTADEATSGDLLQALAREPLVEHVYREPLLFAASTGATPMPTPAPGDIPPTTPSFTSLQTSHEPTPVGHGVRAAAGVYGARGQGVGLFMIEGSWVLDHEDVGQLVAANFLGPVPPVLPPGAMHGLSGSSIVCADRNGYGITGVADGVTMRFLSLDLNGGFENAIALAMANGQPGDVVLVVVMVLMSSIGPGTWLPFEFIQASFDATLTATTNGFHVVVPAGNGDRSLDDPMLLGRFDRNFRDSGAVMVGASAAGALQKASYSNFGSRVDAHSWGDGVVACGYGTLFYPNGDDRQSYTAAATGTSSATPHVAAVVAALQGAAHRQLGHYLSNTQLLDLMHQHGADTPDVIGRRPDLVGMFEAAGILDGLRLDRADLLPGGSLQASIDGPAGSIAALFGALTPADVPLGLNRNIHLDLASMVSLDAFFLPAGSASYVLNVPNQPALQGVDVWLQAVRLTATGPLFLTNSCHATVL